MSDFVTAFESIASHLKAEYESVKARVEEDLPIAADAVSKFANDPVVKAWADAVHLPELPEAAQAVVNFINGMDATIGAAKQQAAEEMQRAQAEAAAQQVPQPPDGEAPPPA